MKYLLVCACRPVIFRIDDSPLFCCQCRKICQLQNPFGEQNPLINDMEDRICQIQVQITAARDEVFLKDIKIY